MPPCIELLLDDDDEFCAAVELLEFEDDELDSSLCEDEDEEDEDELDELDELEDDEFDDDEDELLLCWAVEELELDDDDTAPAVDDEDEDEEEDEELDDDDDNPPLDDEELELDTSAQNLPVPPLYSAVTASASNASSHITLSSCRPSR
jgi:hypothetical protein